MFRIGEFSKIAQVPGSQLRYYDEIGLLKPSKIDEWTGYRYYSAQQLPRLNRILALKGMGMSLEQIKRIMDDDISSDEIRGMFKLKKAQIEQTLQEEIARLRQVESRLKQIDSDDLLDDIDVQVKSLPERPFLSYRGVIPDFSSAWDIMGEFFKVLPAKVGKSKIGEFTALLRCDIYENENIDIEMGFVLSDYLTGTITLPSQRQLEMTTLPAVPLVASAVRIGNPTTAYACRATLANWVESNGYAFDGNGREVFLVPPRIGFEDETVIEIQYPIRKLQQEQHVLEG